MQTTIELLNKLESLSDIFGFKRQVLFLPKNRLQIGTDSWLVVNDKAGSLVPVQREMERERSRLVSIPPLRGGDFQGIGVYRSDVFSGRARKASFRAQHRLDEPTKLSLGMVASPQSPLPFHLARSL
jgi:hypothetical protein